MKVRVTTPARDDLDGIGDYIARDNPVAASRTAYRIRDRFEMLGRQPLLGEVCEDLQPGLRNFPVRPSSTTAFSTMRSASFAMSHNSSEGDLLCSAKR